jgi:excisionase family DNA binding protein
MENSTPKNSTILSGGVLDTKQDLCRKLQVSLRTIDNLIADRRIPWVRVGKRSVRFRWAAVESALLRYERREVH